MNKFEKPFQVCITQRAAIQEGEHFVQTASLAIRVPEKVAYRHLIFTQCLNRGTIFWSECHGNRLEILQQVLVPLHHWMHGAMFLEWFATTYPSAVAIIVKKRTAARKWGDLFEILELD